MGSEDQVHFTKTRVYVKLPYSINDKNPYRGQSKPILKKHRLDFLS
jgi:hypothetical protein